jgi:hypothetical protein
MTQEIAKLSERLAKLERQNKRLRTAGLGLAGLLGVVGLMSMRPLCDTVSAERFVVRDSRGTARMMMDAYATEPTISLMNREGTKVASFGVDQQGEAYLTFFDAAGKARSEGGSKCEATKSEKKTDPIAMK